MDKFYYNVLQLWIAAHLKLISEVKYLTASCCCKTTCTERGVKSDQGCSTT